jgi:AcrR family transcriptional regulator
MTKKILPKRKYDSTHRQAQARETKLRILEAARPLFMERGYDGTTIDAIAERAGVAPETIYATFKNKRKILFFLFDISVGGDDQPIRVIDRPEPQAVLHEMDQQRQLTKFAKDITGILARAAPVFEIMRGAAKTEPEIANLVEKLSKERLQNMTKVAQHLAANGPLREGLNKYTAGEIIWAMTSQELYLLFTRELGWTNETYASWLTVTLTRLLLP